MRHSPLPATLLAIACLWTAGAARGAAEPAAGWESLPARLQRIQAPGFPSRDFPITDYGATGDGKSDATDAIRRAIWACHAAGGGRVLVQGGVFATGPIHLLSHVNLHVAEGATLRFLPEPGRYLPVVLTRFEGTECMNYSPLIYALRQENIAVTGTGTLDGCASAETWWNWTSFGKLDALGKASIRRLLDFNRDNVPVPERIFGDGHGLRPNFIQPYLCRNVLIEGVRVIRSPMWEIHPVLCTNVTVRGVRVESHGPNNDGCNPESCKDVLIEDSLFDTGDDCIAIKSGRNNDGRRVGVPSENIIIRRCVMRDGHGGVVMGSEISGGVRGVFIEDCRMDSPNLDRALRFKSNGLRGGTVEDVFMRRVEIGRVAEAVLTVDFLYEGGKIGPHLPSVRNIHLESVHARSAPRVLWIRGYEGTTIDGIHLTSCRFAGIEGPDIVEHAGTLRFDRVDILPAPAAGKQRSAHSPPE